MLGKLLVALALMALCVAIHAAGVTSAVGWLRSRFPGASRTYWATTALLSGIAGWAILLHLVEIAVWAIFYVWQGGMPDLPTALYFSAVTFTTTGYGDLVLPEPWRLVGGVEALTGIIMCGWSTAFFFAIVLRLYDRDPRAA
ncbi:MAG: two pore domain potassium channel family protein [Chromatiales bacterium]|jgi:voltage-gated potassium channel Kch|nr:two pore domain potassium channel family protein [Chromatiales bacterium]